MVRLKFAISLKNFKILNFSIFGPLGNPSKSRVLLHDPLGVQAKISPNFVQRKTKGQQLKGKIVSALFTLVHTFSHFFPQNFLLKSSLLRPGLEHQDSQRMLGQARGSFPE